MWKNFAAIVLTLILALPLISNAATKVPAKDITVNSSTFSGNLGPNDDSVQKALTTIDQMTGSGVAAVTAVNAVYPLSSTGGTTPTLEIDLSNYLQNGSAVTGSGNAGYIIRWGAPTIGTDSLIYQLGSNIGIGTIVPRATLEIGTGATIIPGSAPVVLIKGNLEVDGKLYGDGSALTNLPAGAETDPVFTAVDHHANWDTAYGWGNHASAGYVTGTPWTSMGYLTAESDPIASAKIGTLTNTKWCYSDGTQIICTQNAPGSGLSGLNQNMVSKAGSPTSIVDSGIYETGGNVGIGTTAPVAGLQIGSGAKSLANPNAPLTSTGVLIKGNLEVDGKIYGDGSGLTGVSASSADHATLSHLDYASAGHTGFQPAGSYLTAESDPVAIAKFGTLTNTKWCTSDGTVVNCTENTPSGTITAVTGSYPIASSGGATPNITVDLSAYPRKGTLTSTKWCDTDGTVINCTQDQPVGTVASVTASFPLTSSGGANPNLAIDLSSYAHTSDLSSYVPTSRQVSTTYPLGGGGTLGSDLTLTIDTSAYPRAGTLTTGKWCTSPDGATIACTQDTPSGTLTAVTGTWPIASSGGTTPNITVDLSAYPQKGTLTNGKWCSSNGTLVSCTEDAPVGASGANPTGTIGMTAVNGSASTFLRSDGAPALGATISPTMTGNWTFTPASGNTLISAGNVGIGTATPRVKVEIGTGGTIPAGSSLAELIKGDLGVDGVIYANGAVIPGIDTGGGEIGGLTTNRLVKAASASTLGSSTVTELGGNVGINTTTPAAGLQVGAGAKSLTATLGTTSALIKGNLEVDGKIYGDGSGITGVGFISGLHANRLVKAISDTGIVDSTVYDVSGNIGIGTAVPFATLDVNGQVKLRTGASGNMIVSSYPQVCAGLSNVILSSDTGIPAMGTANDNTMLGSYPCHAITTGDQNLCVGYRAGETITTGAYNTIVGWYAGAGITDAQYGTYVGPKAGQYTRAAANNTGGTYNVYMGYGAKSYGVTDLRTMVIGPYAINSTGSDDVIIIGGSNNLQNIFQYGNVGIGVTSGLTRLHVDGGTGTDGTVVTIGSQDADIVANDVLGKLEFRGLDSATRIGARIQARATATWGSDTDTAATKLEFYTQGNSATTQLTNPRLVIDAVGNVGIGTTTTARAKLEVDGDVYFANNVGIGTTVPRANLDVDGSAYFLGAPNGGIVRLFCATTDNKLGTCESSSACTTCTVIPSR